MQQQGGPMSLVFPIVLFVLIFYFLIFRPQKKKQQQHEKMISSIGRGDMIVTAGGFFGRVSDILDDSYVIELADGVKVRILKSSISLKRDDGSLEARPKSDRPRKKRRRRPVGETDAKAPIEGGEAGEVGEAKISENAEGVTTEESEALMQGDASGEADSADAANVADETVTAEEEKKNEE